jgi:Domain of unknown function (DUF3854)
MNKIPDDLTRLKGGIRPVAPDGTWTADPAAAWIIADLAKSGITPAAAADARLAYTSCRDRIAQLLNRQTPLPGGCCLVIPYFDAAGQSIPYCRLKPERPRLEHRNGADRPVKYDAAAGCPARLYMPPAASARLTDCTVPLILTEGEKKAIALNQHGFLAVAVAGAWNLLRKLEGVDTGKKFDDYQFGWPDDVPVAGRLVILLFDSDTAAKDNLPLAVKYIRQHLAALGVTVRVACLPDGPNGEKVGADDYLVAHGPAALQQILDAAEDPTAKPPFKNGDGEEKEKKLSAADVLTAIGVGFELWHDPEDRAYASVGRRSYAVKSRAFRLLLGARYREATGGKVPNGEGMGAALLAIEGVAVHERPECDAHVRVAESGGRVYVHLADAEDTVIAIGPDGCRECEDPPVRFLRPRGIRTLPKPRPGGHLDDLRRFLNVPDEAGWALVRAWLAMTFRERGPFPLLVLLGEQGSAKSTTARLLRRLIDPREIALRSQPKDVRDLMIAAKTTWVLAFDNLSGLPDWLSDALCRLATGGGFGTRELYSDDEEQTFNATRPVILNGIEDFVTRPDLLERSLLIRHPPIDEAKRQFDASIPGLLGALFDYVAGGLREQSNVKLPELPRMADFALFAAACELARAGSPDAFLRAYRENQAGANEQVLDESPVACAVRQFMADRDEWQGTPTELLEQMNGHVTEAQRKDREWPKKPNTLSNKLKRLAPSLRKAARIDVRIGDRDPDRKRTRQTVLRRLPDNSPGGSSEASASSATVDSGPSTRAPALDDTRAPDRPLIVHLSSAPDGDLPQESRPADGVDDADDPSGHSSGRVPDPPVMPGGKRRRGRA